MTCFVSQNIVTSHIYMYIRSHSLENSYLHIILVAENVKIYLNISFLNE